MNAVEKRVKLLQDGLSAALARLDAGVAPKAVHRLRTTTRRIETLVAHSGSHLGRKQQKALQWLTGLRKRVGKIRDLDVQIKLLNAIANGSTANDRRNLCEYLQGKREKQEARLASAARKVERAKFQASVQRALEKMLASGESLEISGDAPLRKAQIQLAQLAGEYASHPALRPRRLHELRIRLKAVRYTAEIAEESPEQRKFLEKMKSVQDAIGEWHDWRELEMTAEKRFRDRANCPLLLEIRALHAARYSAALSAVKGLLAFPAAEQRKPPRPALLPRTSVRRA